MRVIDVESATTRDRHWAAATPAAKTAGARRANAKSTGRSEARALLPRIIDALLKFVSTHRIRIR